MDYCTGILCVCTGYLGISTLILDPQRDTAHTTEGDGAR